MPIISCDKDDGCLSLTIVLSVFYLGREPDMKSNDFTENGGK